MGIRTASEMYILILKKILCIVDAYWMTVCIPTVQDHEVMMNGVCVLSFQGYTKWPDVCMEFCA